MKSIKHSKTGIFRHTIVLGGIPDTRYFVENIMTVSVPKVCLQIGMSLVADNDQFNKKTGLALAQSRVAAVNFLIKYINIEVGSCSVTLRSECPVVVGKSLINLSFVLYFEKNNSPLIHKDHYSRAKEVPSA